MFQYHKNSLRNLYNPAFFFLSCLVNFLNCYFTTVLVPEHGLVIGYVAGFLVFLILARFASNYESMVEDDYNFLYAAKFVIGMVVIGAAVLLIDKEYVIFVPSVMGMLYLTVNSIIRSTFVQYFAFVFILLPIYKLMFHSQVGMETWAVVCMLTGASLLSALLFVTNKEAVLEAERRVEILKQVFNLHSGLTGHDVRNATQQMQDLMLPRYRGDLMKFAERLRYHQTTIVNLVNNNIFEHKSKVDIQELLGSLSYLTSHPLLELHTRFTDMDHVTCNYRILFSTVKNFLDNSIEAAERRKQVAVVSLMFSGNKLVIEDNCGGFDTTKIYAGLTSKHSQSTKEHGQFLRVITDPTIELMFGMRTEILRIDDGTRVVITFMNTA